jgi:hypothetical protein
MFIYRAIYQQQWAQMNHLSSFRELQLLMLGMEMDNLANIYQFLKACRCPDLERLFVQVSIFLHLSESLCHSVESTSAFLFVEILLHDCG